MPDTPIKLSTSLLDDLNPLQKQAVQCTEGPVLILAGAGSGKTRVLTYRVAYLIATKKANPENILVQTFTNKAAGEMKERIKKLIGNSAQPIMGTFHSICSKLLRKEGQALGLSPGFTIYDENDALDAVKEAMKTLNISPQKTSPSAIRHTISGAKNEMITAHEYPQYTRGFFQETVAKVYLEYQKILRQNQALDFDDLMLETIHLFQKNPQILTKYQINWRYILVDEYQDTNAAQYLLVKLLANRHKNICVVGDAAQSIYGFRGADFRNIVNFQKDYPNAKVFNLEQNYRSTQTILDAAHAVISENKSHPILKLWTDNTSGHKIKIYESRSEVDEAQFVVNTIKAANRPFSDFAVLYRTNAQSRALEEAFLKSGIPYTLVGGTKFYERKEIKDVLSYLRLLSNPKDSVGLKRIEKIGKGRMQKFFELQQEILVNLDESTHDLTVGVSSLERTASDISKPTTSQSGFSRDKYTTLELLDLILQKTGYLAYIDDETEAGKSRVENVKELRSVAEEFPDLVQFLENVSLVQNDEMPDKERVHTHQASVTLMTIHASKGLEFPTVFLVGLEEGLFPHSRAMLNPNELEEERRLAYVAITRAKEILYLTYTRSRLYFGTRSNSIVSRFLTAIPENLLDGKNKNHLNKYANSFDDDIDQDYDKDDEWIGA